MSVISIDTRIAPNVRNTTALTALKNEVAKYPLMTVEEEVSAFEAYRNETDEHKKMVLREKIANANLRFLISIAQKFSRDGDRVAELISVGTFGLYDAIEKFDPTKGFKFISFAVYWIRSAYSNFFNGDANLVRKTNKSKIGIKDKKIREKFYQEEHREPSEDEIIEALEKEYGIIIKEKMDVVEVKSKSIDGNINYEDDSTFADSPEFSEATSSRNDYENEVEKEHASYIVSQLLPLLTIKERNIVCRYFGIGCEETSIEALAQEYGYVEERIRQIIRGAKAKMLQKAKALTA